MAEQDGKDLELKSAGTKNLQNGENGKVKIEMDNDKVKKEMENDKVKIEMENDKVKVEVDPWELPVVNVVYTKWSDLSCFEKVKRVAVGVGKTILLLGCLYFFICSLDMLSKSFRLIGGKTAGSVFQNSDVLSNPVAGLMIGVLATFLFQSSSTTNGIAISLAVSKVLTVRDVIPIVMGANIGTSTTSTFVAMGQIAKKDEFRRAFAGATVNDVFNWMTVLVFLPIEAATGYLYYLTKAILDSVEFPKSREKRKSLQLLNTLTKPLSNLFVQLDKSVLSEIAKGKEGAREKSIIKKCCKWKTFASNISLTEMESNISSFDNITSSQIDDESSRICVSKCKFMFASVDWSDTTVGIVLLILTIIILSICFFTLVKTLYSVLRGQILAIIRKFINSDFPGIFRYTTGYIAILIGTGITMTIQSSSVFTSALTPLVGLGILSMERMYPLTLGANLGTTFVAIIIALSQNAEDMPIAFHVALCHVFFNVSGVLLYYPIPMTRIPIRIAKFLGNKCARYRWYAIAYLLVLFVIIPAIVFGLSSASWIALAAVSLPVIILLLNIAIIKYLQHSRPEVLPEKLKTWKFLPMWCRSLEPYDNVIRKICCKCCREK